jgi:hypothetical protein
MTSQLPIVNDVRRRLLADGERVARIFVHYAKVGEDVPHTLAVEDVKSYTQHVEMLEEVLSAVLGRVAERDQMFAAQLAAMVDLHMWGSRFDEYDDDAEYEALQAAADEIGEANADVATGYVITAAVAAAEFAHRHGLGGAVDADA